MGLTLDSSGFERHITQVVQNTEAKMVQILADAGRTIAAAARANGNYRDVSGDLRNSNGFLLMIDGVIKAEEFLSGNGGSKARSLALQVADTSIDTICLVVVNGMDYASKVESRGNDVLTSAEQFAKRTIPQMLQQLKR
ncbi:hypothetical protein [Chryseobacterium indologenes]|uniref:hypothetical protein n=1 Tax=Chryseobacterium indologenes TaxID=253 RepID=UPI0007889219|nr:hypothetical protein [Chryseobacterium indologenes]